MTVLITIKTNIIVFNYIVWINFKHALLEPSERMAGYLVRLMSRI